MLTATSLGCSGRRIEVYPSALCSLPHEPIHYFPFFIIQCDLVYRFVHERCQRRREMVTSAGRRIVGDDTRNLNSAMHDLAEASVEANASGDKSTNKKSDELPNQPDTGQIKAACSEQKSHIGLKIHYIHRRIMRDFVDLEWADANTREAMLTFSYYLTMGEMDAAFKAMKLIKSPAVWQVRTKSF